MEGGILGNQQEMVKQIGSTGGKVAITIKLEGARRWSISQNLGGRRIAVAVDPSAGTINFVGFRYSVHIC